MTKSIIIVWLTSTVVFILENGMASYILWDAHWLERMATWEPSGRFGFLLFFIIVPLAIGVFVAAAVQIARDQTK